MARWYRAATDEGSKDDNFLLVLVRHVDKDSGLIAASLLEMPNIINGSTAHQTYDMWNKVREAFSLDWDNFVAYSFDNTNSMIEKHNSFLQEIRSAQGDQKIFEISLPCHLAYLLVEKEAKGFFVNAEDFVIYRYDHFGRSGRRKNQLREYRNFSNNEVIKLINHVSSSRCLSLGRCLGRCNGTLPDSLIQWDSLESFFLSNFDLHDEPTKNNLDEKPNREKRLVNPLKQPVGSCMSCSSSL